MKPFRFLESPTDIDALRAALGRVGLRRVELEGETLVCHCDWLPGPVELVWKLSWWPDGENREDASVTVMHEGLTVARCDVDALLGQKHSRRLSSIIIDELATLCGGLTGKPHRATSSAHAQEPPDGPTK